MGWKHGGGRAETLLMVIKMRIIQEERIEMVQEKNDAQQETLFSWDHFGFLCAVFLHS